jgi:hypothetical protein
MDLDTGIRVVPDQDAWQQVYGVDGEVVHIRAKRFGGRVTLGLNQATPLNRDFVQRLLVDAVSGVVVAPLFVVHKQSGFGWSAPVARLMTLPDAQMAAESTVMNWTFLCPTLVPIAVPGTSTGAGTDVNALFDRF